MKEKNNNLKTIILSLIVMALWGSLFPFVKIGYNAFKINDKDIPSILMFAGTRFFVCGFIILIFCTLKRKTIKAPNKISFYMILLSSFFSIILHYAFTYIGLSSTDSSKTALIKQLAPLLYVCFAFLFISSETFSVYKIIGGIVGFMGIIAINFTSKSISFSIGDILIMLASICSVVATIIGKKVVATNSPFWMTGIGQTFGGTALILAAVIMGANVLNFSWSALGVFAYICSASLAAYLLWNYIMKTSEISNMFIIKFAEPLFACIFGAILLNENIFKVQYLIAFVLISLGIILGNKQTKGKKNESKNI